MRPILLLLAILAAFPAHAQLSDADRAALDRASTRGRLLYAYDQAAWHGTDDMQAKVKDPAERLGGWIVTGPVEAPELVFFDNDPAEPHRVYVAQFRGTTLTASHVLAASEDNRIDAEGRRMIVALAATRAAMASSQAPRCSESPFNSLVLPPAGPAAPTEVYLLTPQTDGDKVPFGGHYRFEVAPDGRVGAPQAFSKSCLSIPLTPPKGTPDRTAAIVVSYLLGPTPSEIHVFTSLTIGKPVYVLTQENGRLWAVRGADIRLVPDKRAKP